MWSGSLHFWALRQWCCCEPGERRSFAGAQFAPPTIPGYLPVTEVAAEKQAARKAAFERRKAAYALDRGATGGHLSSVLAGYRGVPLAGYLPIRTEIDPRPAMAEAAAHGPVGVPVIAGEGLPLSFSRWTPETPLRAGPVWGCRA